MVVRKFVKKPVVVEAVQYFGGTESAGDIIKWAACYDVTIEQSALTGVLYVMTPEGQALAFFGDWIIHEGVMDDFHTCRADVFQATYDPVVIDKEGL